MWYMFCKTNKSIVKMGIDVKLYNLSFYTILPIDINDYLKNNKMESNMLMILTMHILV